MSAASAVRPSPALLLARAYLSRVAEAGSLAVADLVAREGPEQAAALIRRGQVNDAVAAATEARRDRIDPDADLAVAERRGIRFVVPESDQWPHFALACLAAAQQRRLLEWTAGRRTPRAGGELTVPLALWMRGPLNPTRLALRSVAIVGARAASSYGEHIAGEWAHGLARREIAVVSGGAFGIDVAAHRAAIGARWPGVLVSAGGLDRAYPTAHASLYEQVAEDGLLVSESPPGSAPQRHRFLLRNRLIAAFGTGTVVVEAARRSGALNTASHAVALGRPLMVVPGPVTSATSAGCHDLLRRDVSPAILVTDMDDVLDVVGSVGETGASPPVVGGRSGRDGRPAAEAYDRLDPVARRVLDAFPSRRRVHEDDLAAVSGLPAPAVLTAIPILQLAGLVDSGPDGHRVHPDALRGGLTRGRPTRTVRG